MGTINGKNTSKINNAIRKYDVSHIKPSMSRNKKGYYFEMYMQELLERNKFRFKGNPVNYASWLKSQAGKNDCVVLLKDKMIKVEIKYLTNSEIRRHPSWVKRDWLSRDCHIIVANNKWLLSYEERAMIKESGKKIFDPMEFLNYLFEVRSKATLTHIVNISVIKIELSSRSIIIGERSLKAEFKNVIYAIEDFSLKENDESEISLKHSGTSKNKAKKPELRLVVYEECD